MEVSNLMNEQPPSSHDTMSSAKTSLMWSEVPVTHLGLVGHFMHSNVHCKKINFSGDVSETGS
jgi:hypothetical protein